MERLHQLRRKYHIRVCVPTTEAASDEDFGRLLEDVQHPLRQAIEDRVVAQERHAFHGVGQIQASRAVETPQQNDAQRPTCCGNPAALQQLEGQVVEHLSLRAGPKTTARTHSSLWTVKPLLETRTRDMQKITSKE